MATIEHRRVLSNAEAKARRPRRFPGTISPLGWLFALLAVGWTVKELQPLLSPGALDMPRWGEDGLLVVRTLADASVIALPTALAIGFPGARYRNPWLLRGVVLLAMAQLARAGLQALEGWIFENVDPSGETMLNPSAPLGLALGLLSIASALILVGGAWAISDGLDDAGARPRRAVLLIVGGTGGILTVLSIVPYLVFDGAAPVTAAGVLAVAGIAVSFVLVALWFVVAARLLVGWRTGLVPRWAWAIGAASGAAILVERLLSSLLSLPVAVTADAMSAYQLLSLLGAASWILLFAAFALGLGRGWPVRRRRYSLGSTDRVQPL